MAVLETPDLENTQLFLRLTELAHSGACPTELPGSVKTLCNDAADRLRRFPAFHPEFTLHDERHCVRVVQLMGRVLGPRLDDLNAVEVALLILGAYFHDQGMIVDAGELKQLRESDDWRAHEQDWSAEHPNRGELQDRLSDPLLSASERKRVIAHVAELDAAMFTDYVRERHAGLSGKYVVDRYGADPRLTVAGHSLARLLALLCRSHVQPPEDITGGNGFGLDALVGTFKVNVGRLAFVLRLADILDFDRDRTPDSLYRAIDFSSGVSLREWEKHRSVVGWEITPDRIAFAAECEHPAYQRAVLQFLRWIDDELNAAHAWSRSLPAEFEQHRLVLPAKVDTSRVGPRVDAVTGQPIYKYLDLEFSLSRDEIVKLLMTDQLYSGGNLFVRELLQNALDALRYRQALYRLGGIELPDLKVEFEHVLDDAGLDVVRCHDNGVGMDEAVVERFLARVGRSYYRSPEFERERLRFREHGCDFDPCARFGIGFMSCFMFGDQITLRTRRDYGVGREKGEPLVIDITGLSGIVRIRPGRSDQPIGTTVEVRGRRKSFAVDEWDDPVKLLEVLEGYALAAEFPVVGERRIPTIVGRVSIAPTPRANPHPLELVDGVRKHVFTVQLSAADSRLGGEIRVCTLADATGAVVAGNDDGRVEVRRDGGVRSRWIVLNSGKEFEIGRLHNRAQVCCDGVLVAGEPGRGKRDWCLGSHSCDGGFGEASFLIDARSDLKPALTPARTPISAFFEDDRSWRRLFQVAGRGYAEILDDIVERCVRSTAPDAFWVAAEAYGLRLDMLRLRTVWDLLKLPLRSPDGSISWKGMSELGEVRLSYSPAPTPPGRHEQVFTLVIGDGLEFAVPESVSRFTTGDPSSVSSLLFERLVLASSLVECRSHTEIVATPNKPMGSDSLIDRTVGGSFDRLWLFRFAGALQSVIRVIGGRGGFANSEHPVVRRVVRLEGTRSLDHGPLDRLLASIVWGAPTVRFSDPLPEGSWGHRWRTRLSMLFRAVDWAAEPLELQPPYEVFIPGIGIETLTREQIERWGQSERNPNRP